MPKRSFRLWTLKIIRAMWFVFFILFVTGGMIFLPLKWFNDFINEVIDDFVADYWNSKKCLIGFQVFSIAVIFALVLIYLKFFGFIQTSENWISSYLVLISVLTGPFQAILVFHLAKHSSWHFYLHHLEDPTL